MSHHLDIVASLLKMRCQEYLRIFLVWILFCFGGVLVCLGLHMYINIYIHMHLHIEVHSNLTDKKSPSDCFFFPIILISLGLIGKGFTMPPLSQSNVAVQSISIREKVRRLKENIPN